MDEFSLEPAFVSSWKNIRKIRIENFRSLIMKEPIEIKPITLFFGKNGSGKSSFIKAIRFLGANLFPMQRGKTKYMIESEYDLGNFNQIINANDETKELLLEFEEFIEVSNGKIKKSIDYKLAAVFTKNPDGHDFSRLRIFDRDAESGFSLEIYPGEENKQLDSDYIQGFLGKHVPYATYEHQGDAGYPGIALLMKRKFSKVHEAKWKKFYKYLDILPFATTPDSLDLTYFNQLAYDLKFSDEDNKLLEHYVKRYINQIPYLAKKVFNPLCISPVRERPRSRYLLKDHKFDSKEYYGLLNQIDEFNENFNPFYPGVYTDLSLEEYLNLKLSEFNLGQKLEIVKKDGVGSLFITDPFNSVYNFAEASSGLIQILPILINEYINKYYVNIWRFDLDLRGTQVNFIEQPELHLHPLLQTKLAEFIVRGVNTYVIETHSEHIVRKMQVLIARGELKKERVSVYYFDKDKTTGITSIKEMELEDNGFFKEPWPDGFFDDSYNLAKELIYARKN